MLPHEHHQIFNQEQEEEIKDFFLRYGYVVVRNIISEEQIERTNDELWESEHLIKQKSTVNRHNPDTWDSWPSGIFGFINPTNDFKLKTAYENRQNENLVRLFQLLLNEKALWVSIGRFGIMRPTKNVKFIDGRVEDKPEWKTTESWLHWDQNPWSEPGFHRLQGLITLSDHTEESGGFACIPGFNNKFDEWANENPVDKVKDGSTTQIPFMVPEDDQIQKQVKKIIMEKGCALIWDSRLPHQNYPNNNDSFRIVQYINYRPFNPAQFKEKNQSLHEKLQSGVGGDIFPRVLSTLGMKLVGLIDWNDNETTEDDIHRRYGIGLSPNDALALDYLKIAQNLENEGEPMKAVEYYRKAIKLNPDIENLFKPNE